MKTYKNLKFRYTPFAIVLYTFCSNTFACDELLQPNSFGAHPTKPLSFRVLDPSVGMVNYFPYQVLSVGELMSMALELANRDHSSGSKPEQLDFSPIPTQMEPTTTPAASQETTSHHRPNILLGLPQLGASPSVSLYTEMLREVQLKYPQTRMWGIRWKNLGELFPEFVDFGGVYEAQMTDAPIRFLPREIQREILLDLILTAKDEFLLRSYKNRLLQSENTSLALDRSPPRQPLPEGVSIIERELLHGLFFGLGRTQDESKRREIEEKLDEENRYDGNLNPETAANDHIFFRIINHYFPDRVQIDRWEYFDVMNRHAELVPMPIP